MTTPTTARTELMTMMMMVDAREIDDRFSRFLYAGDDVASSVIHEYLIHMASPDDYSSYYHVFDRPSEQDSKPERDVKQSLVSLKKKLPGDEHEETRHIRPHFLNGREKNGPRVVEFYSPWCGHCQRFKPKYIELAKEFQSRGITDTKIEVKFYAVSCSEHHWVCKDNNITTYPTVKAYKANSVNGQILESFTPEFVADAIGVSLLEKRPSSVDEQQPMSQKKEHRRGEGHNTRGSMDSVNSNVGVSMDDDDDDEVHYDDVGYNERPHIDILGASLDGYTRTKNDVYNDATLSFLYALKTDIFPPNDPYPLSPEQKRAFVEWIDLLYWTLPPIWRLHTLINDIRSNIDDVVLGQHHLSHIVDLHRDVVMLDNDKNEWSKLCRHGQAGAGYACGLWSLFHIVSVGVKERHKAVLGARDRVSTAHAAKTLRDYIANFMGCRECQDRFLEMYDNCGFQHCTRFDQQVVDKRKRGKNIPPPPETWEEFTLWLWEVHNDVNQQLVMDEIAIKEGGREATAEELNSMLWPKAETCSACRDDGGNWNRKQILQHLTTEYWPGGVHNFRYVVLDKKIPTDAVPARRRKWNFFDVFLCGCSIASLLYWFMKRRHLAITGRHKKFENDFVNVNDYRYVMHHSR